MPDTRRASALRVVCILLLSASPAIAGCGRSSTSDPASTSSLALADGTLTPGDGPSPQAIMLHLKDKADGSSAQTSLRVEIENTVARELDVELHVVSEDRGRQVERGIEHFHVSGKSSIERAIPVADLGMQLVGISVPTRIYATYTDIDGVPRLSALHPIWVAHDRDFSKARVRTAGAEAKANQLLSAENLRSAAGAAPGRASQFPGGPFAALNDGDFSSLPARTMIVHQPASLPDPNDKTLWVPFEDQSADTLVEKAGAYNICFTLPYWYVDSGFGEDYMTSSYGNEPARYMFAVIADSANDVIYLGALNASGCTGSLTHANGLYFGYVTTSLYRSASDVSIHVTFDETAEYQWFTQAYSISGSGGTVTLNMSGASSMANAALAAGNALYRSTPAFATGATITMYTDGDDTGAYTSGGTIWYGYGTDGWSRTLYKSVLLHELGHAVQNYLFGSFKADYSASVSITSCRCDHVESSNSLHCLQGREYVYAAQQEGFGHFFAADNWNDPSHSNCTFAYYKEFLEDGATQPVLPPVAKSCLTQTRWMENHCNAAGRGTEFDWLGFYWYLANKTTNAYSYANLNSVYRTACGGAMCSGATVSWSALQSAANSVFGSGSAKALFLNQTGVSYGVKH